MKKVLSLPIYNARYYFIKRAFIYLAIRLPFLASLVRLFNKNKPTLSVYDVEQIFYICGCDREAENIAFIKFISSKLCLDEIFDIGCNFGQFIESISEYFKYGVCVDANPEAVSFIKSNTNLLSKFEIINKAVVPSDFKENTVTLKIPRGNSGKAMIGDVEDEEGFYMIDVETISILDIDEKFGKKESNRFVKFDIEGLEADLVRDYLSLGRRGDVLAFEVLTESAKNDLDHVFLEANLNYSFITIRYSFLDNTGYMGKNILGLLKMYITGKANLDFYVSDRISDFPFGFMSLVFAIQGDASVLEDIKYKLTNIRL